VHQRLRGVLLESAAMSGWVCVRSALTGARGGGGGGEHHQASVRGGAASSREGPAEGRHDFERRFVLVLPSGWLVGYADEQLTQRRERVPLTLLLALGASRSSSPDPSHILQLEWPGGSCELDAQSAASLSAWKESLLTTLHAEGRHASASLSSGRGIVSMPDRLQRAIHHKAPRTLHRARGALRDAQGAARLLVSGRRTTDRGRGVEPAAARGGSAADSAELSIQVGHMDGADGDDSGQTGTATDTGRRATREFEALERVPIALGRTLFMLRHNRSQDAGGGGGAGGDGRDGRDVGDDRGGGGGGGGGTGLVIDVSSIRGVRTLKLSSSVSVVNKTGSPIELRLERPSQQDHTASHAATRHRRMSSAVVTRLRGNAQGTMPHAAANSPAPARFSGRSANAYDVSIPEGQSAGLPLQMAMARGSTDALCEALEVRPDAMWAHSLMRVPKPATVPRRASLVGGGDGGGGGGDGGGALRLMARRRESQVAW
jgi:hypothetical protein